MHHNQLFSIATDLERNESSHLARILILVLAFERPDGPSIQGITKLVKLDFLLRYPANLEKALIARGVSPNSIPVDKFERRTIEAQMVRYRYGPWDHRYRRFLNVLAARRLLRLELVGRTIQIDVTDAGRVMAQSMAERDEFSRTHSRAKLLRSRLDVGATRLKDFIYETFPEIVSLEFNDPILLAADIDAS